MRPVCTPLTQQSNTLVFFIAPSFASRWHETAAKNGLLVQIISIVTKAMFPHALPSTICYFDGKDLCIWSRNRIYGINWNHKCHKCNLNQQRQFVNNHILCSNAMRTIACIASLRDCSIYDSLIKITCSHIAFLVCFPTVSKWRRRQERYRNCFDVLWIILRAKLTCAFLMEDLLAIAVYSFAICVWLFVKRAMQISLEKKRVRA